MIRRLLLPLVTLVAVLAGAIVLGSVVPADTWSWNRTERPDADALANVEPLALDWEDLVPAGFEPAPDPFENITPERLDKLYDGSEESRAELAEIEAAMRYAPVDESLDGQLVTLPGYVVPLDFDGATRLEDFLLVPYFGACVHTPPPPANQIVMASLEEPVEIGDSYAPVQLRGILYTESTRSALAETGYRMQVLSLEPFEP